MTDGKSDTSKEKPENAGLGEPIRIRAEEARPGDKVAPVDGHLDPFVVTETRIDGGFIFILGSEQPWSVARRESILKFDGYDAAQEEGEEVEAGSSSDLSADEAPKAVPEPFESEDKEQTAEGESDNGEDALT